MSRKYFGTDGVRGRVGQSPITPDFVMRLGYSAGKALLGQSNMPTGERPAVLIGKDTRLSGYMLESALEAGFSAAGIDVFLVGPLPTPAVAYLTRALRLQAGIVISASHNPYYDNGIKFFSAQGTKLPDAVERAIEEGIDQPIVCAPPADLGRVRRIEDARGRYIEFCKSTFPNDLDLRGLKIVVDCAHGAAYHIAPSVFHELGADVVTIGAQPNGLNINDGVGATAPKALCDAVLANRADLGVALDGDADRLQMVDAEGNLYDGDQLLFAIVRSRARVAKIKGVVGTLMSNLALEHALGKIDIPFARAAVGDRYVVEMLNEKGWLYGGENSGHILAMDRHTTGDGIVAALQVLAALREVGGDLKGLLGGLALYPQKLINVPITRGFQWRDHPAISAALVDAEAALAGRGRVLLRASGTEPLLRVMVEGEDASEVACAAEKLAGVVRQSTQ
ncbi:MAG: phosphoglucosamine mutase [Gammaproteobacteria bacterium]|jgi:phosphoglucosamine mutase|nr:phosphoglucosamine mutase [Gammaproteobacteria bacterium]MBU1603400.1 phosphoglucosamine mutase [Gammaproteobacteria bacterium]MBU2432920.1 phosphoglucosamine mutase [Gammaproteobacteria bacterium]MBU2450163.1 phosphoglucosamine mutase [Gammaproteobacteria bacterium]PKO47127.1 MAG: phosphoglucosamine mutase [Betaproteobacteria bacterium HGW-Betaproteobacteria-4]